jgi:LmbE family N-acetylglucosaminyl deacetylase
VVDITDHWEQKLETIRAFKSQFFDPENTAPNTYISNPEFLPFIEARAREMGHKIGTTFGEGFTKERHLGVRSLFDLL